MSPSFAGMFPVKLLYESERDVRNASAVICDGIATAMSEARS